VSTISPQGYGMTSAQPRLDVLALNSGSSSLKFGMYQIGSSQTEMLLSGEAESIGDRASTFHAEDSRRNALVSEKISFPSQREAILRIGRLLVDSKMPAPVAIGHRIVHGGPRLPQHCVIDNSVLRQLEAATAFAPLHIPLALSLIRFAQEHFHGLPHIACFDTTFHTGLAEVARVLPIAKELQLEGIQRYGFHGLSCESIVHQLGNDLPICATNPWATASRRNSVTDQRANGRPRRDGNSQASALISTLTAGGKKRRPADARLIFQPGQPVDVETLAPLADDLARRIQANANDIVRQPLAGQQHDLGPDHRSIGRPISARPPDQLRAFPSRQLDEKRAVPRHDVPPAKDCPLRFACPMSTKYVTVFMKLGTKLKSDEFCSVFLRCCGGGECRQSIAR
jgi:hypothetical protein